MWLAKLALPRPIEVRGPGVLNLVVDSELLEQLEEGCFGFEDHKAALCLVHY